MSGLELLRLLRALRHVAPPVILLGEEADVRAAVAAMREGAVDFIEKPHIDVVDPASRRVPARSRVSREVVH